MNSPWKKIMAQTSGAGSPTLDTPDKNSWQFLKGEAVAWLCQFKHGATGFSVLLWAWQQWQSCLVDRGSRAPQERWGSKGGGKTETLAQGQMMHQRARI